MNKKILVFVRLEETVHKLWHRDGIIKNSFIKHLHTAIKKDLKHTF
jgi:nitric oxide reductase activation protein